MTDDVRWKQRFDNYGRALAQLDRAVELAGQRELTDLEKQGVIQGFEFVHELAWNVLKDYLEYEGIQGLIGSRGAAREAFKRGLVTDGDVWMDMIAKRHLSSHTYDAGVAQELVSQIIERYHPAFAALRREMAGRARRSD
jgi:nucleotidyltransferase substrate binding protein (TIGR01987 family)